MSDVLHPSFNFDQQLAHDLRQKQLMAKQETDESWRDFDAAIPQWRHLTSIANSKFLAGVKDVEYPPIPKVPLVYTINEARHREAFTKHFTTRQDPNAPLSYDWSYFDITPAPIPAGLLDRWPVNNPMKGIPGHNPPPANDEDPVGGPLPGRNNKGRHRFIGNPGSWEVGDTYKENGIRFTLVRLRGNPFNQDEVRYVWVEPGVEIEAEELYGYNVGENANASFTV